MLTIIQYATLKSSILGTQSLAAMISTTEGGTLTGGSQDANVFAAINASSSGTIRQAAVDKNTILSSLSAFNPNIAQLTGASLTLWQEMKGDLRAAPGPFQYAVLNPVLEAAVPGIIPSQAAIDAIWTRPQTLLESWFGVEGFTISLEDVGYALRGLPNGGVR